MARQRFLPEVTFEEWWQYFHERIPCALDDTLAGPVRAFSGASDSQRGEMRLTVDRQSYLVVMSFAHRMATLAVRERSIERLRLGLHAFALAGDSPESDWRDEFGTLAALGDAGARLGRAVLPAYAEAARMAHPATARRILWVQPFQGFWRELDRLLGRLVAGDDWRPTRDADGFRYGTPTAETIDDVNARVGMYKNLLEAQMPVEGAPPLPPLRSSLRRSLLYVVASAIVIAGALLLGGRLNRVMDPAWSKLALLALWVLLPRFSPNWRALRNLRPQPILMESLAMWQLGFTVPFLLGMFAQNRFGFDQVVVSVGAAAFVGFFAPIMSGGAANAFERIWSRRRTP